MAAEVDIVTSDLDHRRYQHVTLENGVEVLLIEDPRKRGDFRHQHAPPRHPGDATHMHTNHKKHHNEWLPHGISKAPEDEEYDPMCSAAVILKVGSYSDPQELQGAAHFLEHMLFLGNRKYPAEGELDAYLARNAGDSNAFTDAHRAIFHFDVDADGMRGALDRFAHLFVSPRLSASAMAREVQAIDAEFEAVVALDAERLQQLQAATARPGHPCSKFAWGDRRSLWEQPQAAGVDVHAVLRRHSTQYCGAQNLAVVLIGAEPLPKLRRMASEVFAAVPRAPLDAPDYSRMPLPFEGQMLHVAPAVSSSSLMITWQWPRAACPDRARAAGGAAAAPVGALELRQLADYLSYVLQWEGEGSLVAALKGRGWASQAEAFCDDCAFSRNSAYWLFQVEISLTPAGAAAAFCPGQTPAAAAVPLAPLRAVFEYLGRLARNPPQHCWDELKAAAEADFRYDLEPEDMSEHAAEVAEQLMNFPRRHCMAGPFLFADFDAAAVSAALRAMLPTPGTPLRVDTMVQQYDAAAPAVAGLPGATTSFEPWFQFPFTSAPLPTALTESWAAEGVEATAAGAALRPPPPNPYIDALRCDVPAAFDAAGDFVAKPPAAALDTAPAGGLHFPSEVARRRVAPKKLLETAEMRLWHLPAVYHHTPAAQVNVRLATPAFTQQPGLALLLCRLWRAAAAPAATAAAAAGLHVDWSNLADGGAQGDAGELCPAAGVAVEFSGWSSSMPAFVEDVFAALGAACCRLDAAEAAGSLPEAALAAAGYGGPSEAGDGVASAAPADDEAAGGARAEANRDLRSSQSMQEAGGRGERAVELGMLCVLREEGALAGEADELALSVLEQTLCSPSCAVPSLALPDGPAANRTLREFAGECLSTLSCDVLAAGNIPPDTAHAMAERIADAISKARIACGARSADSAGAAAEAGAQHAVDGARAGVRVRGGRRKQRTGGSRGPGMHATRPPLQRCIKLPEGSDIIVRCCVQMPHAARSACVTYMQLGPQAPAAAATAAILAEAMRGPAYDYLRTKLQLGYDVDVIPCSHAGAAGVAVSVAGAAAAAGRCRAAVADFLHGFAGVLGKMPKSEFNDLRASAAMEMPATVSDLASEVDDAWPRIMDGTLAFDRISREAAAARACTLKEVRKAFATCLLPTSPQRRCLTVEVYIGPPRGDKADAPAARAADHGRVASAAGEVGAADCRTKQHVVSQRRGAGDSMHASAWSVEVWAGPDHVEHSAGEARVGSCGSFQSWKASQALFAALRQHS